MSFTPHIVLLDVQSPFLFPIVFSINLIPFFDICSVDSTCCSFTPVVLACAALLGPLHGRMRNSCCLWLWQLVFGVSLRAATSNLPSSPTPAGSDPRVGDGLV